MIPNPVSSNMPEPFTGERKKQIVAVGRLQPQKNHKLLLEAFADFQKNIRIMNCIYLALANLKKI